MKRAVIFATLIATPAAADPEVYGHMGGTWGYSYGAGMMFGPVLWLIVLGLVVAGMVWFLRQQEARPDGPAPSARTRLDMRFAAGEIDAEEYTARKRLLQE